MRDIRLKGVADDRRTSRQSLLADVRGACETLLLTHPTVVESIIVSRSFDDPAGARLASRTAVRLAEEYHLEADVTESGSALVIRMSRNGRHIHLPRPTQTSDDRRRR
jgi:hypothetical protein